MTELSQGRILTLTAEVPDPALLRLALTGDLDHESADELLDALGRLIDAHPGAADLHLDCSGLGLCDSSGLSALIMARRRTAAAGIALHLDRRPAALDRLLDLTGVLAHLTGLPHA